MQIAGAQFETDGCYETENKILIIEAKCGSKPCKSFNIRQLYYPYRVVYDTQTKKDIVALFVECVRARDGTECIHIFKYIWENPKQLDSIKQVGYYTACFPLDTVE